MLLDNLRQVRLGAVLLGPLSIIASALILPKAWPLDAAPVPNWPLAVGLTHLLHALVLLTLGLLAHTELSRSHQTRMARLLPLWAAVVILVAGLALNLFYQWVEPKTSPMTLTAVGVGLLLYLRPPIAAVLYCAVALMAFFMLPMTQDDPALLASGRVSGVAIPLAGLAFSVLSWRRNTVRILLSRSLETANAALALKQTELEQMAWHDGLTGLCNRSEFMRRADQELLRAQRHHFETSFLMLDLDHFKRVNDRLGHPVGDMALRHVSAVLTECLRGSDLVARLGGEEFIVLLPQTGLSAALHCAEKLRSSVQDQPLHTEQGSVPITVSLGALAVQPEAGTDMTRVYAAIDRALYLAKACGRNRVEVASMEVDCA